MDCSRERTEIMLDLYSDQKLITGISLAALMNCKYLATDL